MSELIMQVKNITKNFPASNNRFLILMLEKQ